MSSMPPPKKPKMRSVTIEEKEERTEKLYNENSNASYSLTSDEKEQEEAYIALIEHHTREVEHLRNRVTYYTSQLEEEEIKLGKTKLELARLRRGDKSKASKPSSSRPSEVGPSRKETEPKRTKRSLEHKEERERISMIKSSSSPSTMYCQGSTLIPSPHKRRLRSLLLSPTNHQLFATSGLDGVVNMWLLLQKDGSDAHQLSSNECLSSNEGRCAEDMAWHPDGNSLFSVYNADGEDSQVSIVNLGIRKEEGRVSYLEWKPHVKGIINKIMFMPWNDDKETQFVTCGSDNYVVMWSEKDSWKPNILHKSLHSSAVMGVAGLAHKKIVLSVGLDNKILGYNVTARRIEYQLQIETNCMSVVTNPCDFNLFMVHTGERPGIKIHSFGWKQESSDSQSELINQAWSPDGLHITSGSTDPLIHIFDIRYRARTPFYTFKAHQKQNRRVFKAAWHTAHPLLVSISDFNIGLHNLQELF